MSSSSRKSYGKKATPIYRDAAKSQDSGPGEEVFIQGVSSPRGTLADIGLQAGKGIAQGAIGEAADVLSFLRNAKQQYLVPEQHRKSPQQVQQERPLPTSSAMERGLESLGIDPQPQGAPGRYAQRTGRGAGRLLQVLLGGGPSVFAKALPVGLGAAAVGQSVQEATGSELAGDITEIASGIGAGALRKGVVPRKGQERIVQTAKTYKIPDEQVAALVKDPKTFRRWGKIASKGESGERFVKDLQKSMGSALDEVKDFAKNVGRIPKASQSKLAKSVRALNKELGGDNKTLTKMSSSLQGGHTTAEELVDMYRKVGREGGGARKQTWRVKEAIVNAMTETNAELGAEFTDLNKMYGRYIDINSKLQPGKFEDVYTLGKAAGLADGVLSGDLNKLMKYGKKAIGIEVGRKAVLKYLTSSRTQGNAQKLVEALNNNKMKAAQQILSRMEKDLEEASKEE